MSIANLKIAHKLWLGFGGVLFAMLMATGVVYVTVNFNSRATAASASLSEVLDGLDRANAAHLDQAHTARGYILTQGVARHRNLYNEAVKQFEDIMVETRAKAASHPDVVESLDLVVKASRSWREFGDKMIEFAAAPATIQKAVEVAQSKEASDRQAAYRETSAKARGVIASLLNAAADFDQMTRTGLNYFLAIGAIAGCLIAALIGWFLSKSISDPTVLMTEMMTRLAQGDSSIALPDADRRDEIGAMAKAILVFKDAALQKGRLEREKEQARTTADSERQQREQERAEQARQSGLVLTELGRGLEHLAKGDLTYRLTERFPTEAMEQLRDHFNHSMQQLQDAMSIVASKASTIGQSSREIQNTTDELSRRSEQQAANLEESVSALAGITKTVKATAEGAGLVHDAVAGAAKDAAAAGDIVMRATEAMKQIDQSSRKITQIVGMIHEIAFQTNLLALNAGVEAARAGDAGRGFAVVASEVRALAQRASDATKQIERLIQASKQQVERGVDLVDETSVALVNISKQVTDINGVVEQIAYGAREQAASLQEINTATTIVDETSQQNVAMIEETSTAIHALSDDTAALMKLISRFKLDDHQRMAPASSSRMHAPARAARG